MILSRVFSLPYSDALKAFSANENVEPSRHDTECFHEYINLIIAAYIKMIRNYGVESLDMDSTLLTTWLSISSVPTDIDIMIDSFKCLHENNKAVYDKVENFVTATYDEFMKDYDKSNADAKYKERSQTWFALTQLFIFLRYIATKKYKEFMEVYNYFSDNAYLEYNLDSPEDFYFNGLGFNQIYTLIPSISVDSEQYIKTITSNDKLSSIDSFMEYILDENFILSIINKMEKDKNAIISVNFNLKHNDTDIGVVKFVVLDNEDVSKVDRIAALYPQITQYINSVINRYIKKKKEYNTSKNIVKTIINTISSSSINDRILKKRVTKVILNLVALFYIYKVFVATLSHYSKNSVINKHEKDVNVKSTMISFPFIKFFNKDTDDINTELLFDDETYKSILRLRLWQSNTIVTSVSNEVHIDSPAIEKINNIIGGNNHIVIDINNLKPIIDSAHIAYIRLR